MAHRHLWNGIFDCRSRPCFFSILPTPMGQTSVDGEGRPVHSGDMRAQLVLALDNLEAVLREAGLTLADVVRLNYYTTDVDAFFGASGIVMERLAGSGCRPASTLLGVARLAFPELLVEIEATAVG